MNVLPVIEREMRAQSRLAFTYWLRVLSACALLFVAIVFWANYGLSSKVGSLLFSYLNCALFVSIWVLVPLLAADCISRERREGTVGLLFLTPLKAREIVLSKGLAHGVRSLSLWIAVLPVLTIAFLLGGVTWKEAALSVLMNFSSICWALAAGLIASSFSKTWLRAMLLSGGLAMCFSVVFIVLVGGAIMGAAGSDSAFRLPFPYQFVRWQYAGNWWQWLLPTGFFAATDGEAWWGAMFGSLTRPSQRAWLVAAAETALFSMLFLLGAVQAGAWKLRRSWQDEPPSARRVWMEQTFCTPVVGVKFFHRWLRKKLERNPIGWLEQRTWTGRLVTWGWFAVMISFYSAVFYVPNVNTLLSAVQRFMAWSLLTLISVSAAGSFQRERETRVLELLLVSPMTAGDIITGRLRGLWGQFLPALLLMLGVWIYLAEIFTRRGDFALIPYFCAGYVTLPIIGLYYSLKRATFIGSFLSTLLVGLLLPQALRFLTAIAVEVLLGLLDSLLGSEVRPGGGLALNSRLNFYAQHLLVLPVAVTFFQSAIAIRLGRKLHQNLLHRSFAFSTSPS